MRQARLYFLLLFVGWIVQTTAQRPTNNFHHLTPDDGLSNEAVRSITQDKYGFIWLGTNFGLNRFDGVRVKTWYSVAGDTTSISNNFVRSLYGDKRGRIWVGGDPGFCQYDYASNKFIRYQNSGFNMLDIAEDSKGTIWVGTNGGLKTVDTVHHVLVNVSFTGDSMMTQLFKKTMRDIHCGQDGLIYIATNEGVIIFDPSSSTAKLISQNDPVSLLPLNDVTALTIDSQNNLWVGCGYSNSVVVRISADRKSAREYDSFRRDRKKYTANTIQKIYTDNKGRVWVASTFWGLDGYDAATDRFVRYHTDPLLPNSINSNHAISFYHDKNGMLWVGTEGLGANYFNPDQDIFSSIQQNKYLPSTLPDNWTRTFLEDRSGRLWVGTGMGLVVLNKERDQVILDFLNQDSARQILHSLSIRSLMEDKNGSIWIGTADGLNRYHPATGKMDFYDQDDGIPISFIWFIRQLDDGRIIIGTNRGLFEYQPATNTFYNYANDPVLGKYHYGLRCFNVDSHGRWWIGSFGNGITVYDPVSKTIVRRIVQDSTASSISINMPHDMQEDAEGNMWIATRYRLNCFNLEKNTNKIYSVNDGLPSDWIAGLMFDDNNRLWVATGKGLCVMSKERKVMKVFGLSDGLLTTQFNDQPVYKTKDGRFLYSSMKGLMMVDPASFNWVDSSPDVYITSFKVLNKEWKDPVNLEELKHVSLTHAQNFFSFELMGLQYYNPGHVWYAYKLDGFDKDWVYTQERVINYTNVPGGDYTFRYKASTDINNWNVIEKTLSVHIGKVFYQTAWFWLLAGLVIAAILYILYQNRLRQQRQVYLLQSKAQSLEKEKALVMYENLKQQLNPHFLFNSLTSLSSLIRVDQKTAGEFLDSLSKTYRYILKNRDSELVPLLQEIRFAETYIKLQQTRFEKGLQVKIDVDEEYHHRRIAPITLQNMIENAIKHNIIDEESPLVIDIYVEDEHVVVRNNLQKKNFVETSNKQGLVNLQSLYQYLSNAPVEIKEDTQFFMVKIPLL